jgi:hypothetical protein
VVLMILLRLGIPPLCPPACNAELFEPICNLLHRG